MTFACAEINKDSDNQSKSITNRDSRHSKISSNRPVDPGHQRMLNLLAEIAAKTTDRNPYLGNATVNKLNKEIESLRGGNSPKHAELFFTLGFEELKIGQNHSAIKHLKRAESILSKYNISGENRTLTLFKLGVAYMRLGETQNCCLRNTPDSCIVPIREGGLHTDKEGSEQAIKYFTKVLESTQPNNTRHMASRWLLNIMHMTLGTYPDKVPKFYLIPPDVFESPVEFPRFKNIASYVGVDTFNLSGGLIVEDFNNDGYLDIITSTWDSTAAGQMRLFQNDQTGTFTDQTEQAGLLGLTGGLNMVQADYNNDGFIDVLVLRGAWLKHYGRHPNSLLRNNGDGTFTDVTFAAGLGNEHRPTQTADWADFDNDGNVDLFIGNESETSNRFACQLFHNNGDGTFTDTAKQAGVANYSYVKGVSCGDFNNDRFPDIYLSNYSGPNRLYKNNGNGTFTDVAQELHVTRPNVSFPAWFWDFNNDGNLDIYAASYTGRVHDLAAFHFKKPAGYEPPCLYQGSGGGPFDDVTDELQLNFPVLPMGSNFGDINNDGYLDFYLGTGDPSYFSLMPNIMYLNQEGKSFLDVTMAGGFGHLQKGHAIAFADPDHDGDQDVFEQMGGAFAGDKYNDALYENKGFGNHWITIKAIGVTSNKAAIGARLHLRITEKGKTRSVYKHINSGGSFGGNPFRQTIGLGQANQIDLLELYWPTTDQTQMFKNIPADQIIQIVEDEDQYTKLNLKTLNLGKSS